MFSDLYVQDIRIREIDNECYYKYLPVIKSIIENEKMEFTTTRINKDSDYGKKLVADLLILER